MEQKLIIELEKNAPKWANEAIWYFKNSCGEQWLAKTEGNTILIAGSDMNWEEISFNSQQGQEFMELVLDLKKPTNNYKNNPLSKWNFNFEEQFWLCSVIEASKHKVKNMVASN